MTTPTIQNSIRQQSSQKH